MLKIKICSTGFNKTELTYLKSWLMNLSVFPITRMSFRSSWERCLTTFTPSWERKIWYYFKREICFQKRSSTCISKCLRKWIWSSWVWIIIRDSNKCLRLQMAMEVKTTCWQALLRWRSNTWTPISSESCLFKVNKMTPPLSHQSIPPTSNRTCYSTSTMTLSSFHSSSIHLIRIQTTTTTSICTKETPRLAKWRHFVAAQRRRGQF